MPARSRQVTRHERNDLRHYLQMLSEMARSVRNAVEPETGVLGFTVEQWRGQWAAMTRDLDSVTERMADPGDRQGRIFLWDWSEQPPMEAIAAEVARLSALGRPVFMREHRTGSDAYAWIVSDYKVDDAEAERIDEADTVTPEELEAPRDAP